MISSDDWPPTAAEIAEWEREEAEARRASRARFLCVDCGKDTCGGEYYMVDDDVWAASGIEPNGGMLCLADLERRIGRALTFDDFTAVVPSAEAWDRHVAARVVILLPERWPGPYDDAGQLWLPPLWLWPEDYRGCWEYHHGWPEYWFAVGRVASIAEGHVLVTKIIAQRLDADPQARESWNRLSRVSLGGG